MRSRRRLIRPKYIERFVSMAQTHLNLVDAGVDRYRSHKFFMNLLVNENITGQQFLVLIASIVSAEKSKSTDTTTKFFLTTERWHVMFIVTSNLMEGNYVRREDR